MSHFINGLCAREFLENMVKDCFIEPSASIREVASRYMSLDFSQTTDGKSITRDEQIAHMEYLQENIASLEFNIQQVVYDGEWLAERHIGRATFKNGRRVESEVSTFFRIIEGKITETHEVTRPMTGNENDRGIHTIR